MPASSVETGKPRVADNRGCPCNTVWVNVDTHADTEVLAMRPRHVGPLVLPLLLIACGNSTTMERFGQQYVEAAHAERWQVNPQPKRAYRLIATVENAPGPLVVKDGWANFVADNCSYTLNRLEGVDAHPDVNLPVAFAADGQGRFVGTVYLDAMLDEAYYGRDVCRWKLKTAVVVLKPPSDKPTYQFGPAWFGTDIEQGVERQTLFFKSDYSDPPGAIDIALEIPETANDYPRFKGDPRVFVVRLSVKEHE